MHKTQDYHSDDSQNDCRQNGSHAFFVIVIRTEVMDIVEYCKSKVASTHMFEVIGYDKDADTEMPLAKSKSREYAMRTADILADLCKEDALCVKYQCTAPASSAEPFDCIRLLEPMKQ